MSYFDEYSFIKRKFKILRHLIILNISSTNLFKRILVILQYIPL